ncbi:energy-coupling factor ABC transporter permease [Denitromonas iodatirespirans]|uniref:Energy-coupling factor ABC transporter permease n=1 Tax=Denitromonas iodatirespirans TaxID=2795389 RepID=A0A944DBV8_DENI1|nr:energy-coupling factor ABC transporter permease [Denitromonas iodatirespirans]MBT0962577.1 energy-coupling factor ABC transporter permease [Denitromonas iodatirespirans]
MHIEPGIVEGSKLLLGYGTAAAAAGVSLKLAIDTVRRDGAASLLLRSLLTTALVFSFFEVLPHHPVGVSEVHLILGTTLMLLFGTAPAALGLAGGLLIQGVLFAPFDLPQYGINVTTLLVPLFATAALARRIIPASTAYVDVSYGQALKLSLAYQGGIVAWVAFWAFYGQGVGADTLASVSSFGAAYMSVVLLEPLVDLAVLAIAKQLHRLKGSIAVDKRLYHAHA